MEYSQPNFYHFNEDSIKLSKWVALEMGGTQTKLRILDLGAGCGVVGLEISLLMPQKISSIDFVEKQHEFKESLEENIKRFKNKEMRFNAFMMDAESFLNETREYDLIVSNPPYFIEGESRPSLNKNTRICRSWERSKETSFFESIIHALKKNGVGFCSYRGELGKILKNNDVKIKLLERSGKTAFYRFSCD